MRKRIGTDLHPEIRRLPVVLTETVLPPTEGSLIDEQEALALAFRRRPEPRKFEADPDRPATAESGLLTQSIGYRRN